MGFYQRFVSWISIPFFDADAAVVGGGVMVYSPVLWLIGNSMDAVVVGNNAMITMIFRISSTIFFRLMPASAAPVSSLPGNVSCFNNLSSSQLLKKACFESPPFCAIEEQQ